MSDVLLYTPRSQQLQVIPVIVKVNFELNEFIPFLFDLGFGECAPFVTLTHWIPSMYRGLDEGICPRVDVFEVFYSYITCVMSWIRL